MTIDYRRFLGAGDGREEGIGAYFGGGSVEVAGRRLRVSGQPPPAAGFWRFEVRGRTATPVAPADPPDLAGCPAVRGYAVAGYLAGPDGRARRLAIGPAEQPPRFAPLVARQWHSGELVFDTLDFESGVEEQVRAAYLDRRGLRGQPGVPAALRAAFGYAVWLRVAGELRVPARPVEAYSRLAELADEGEPAARALLARAVAARAAEPGRAPGRVDRALVDRALVDRARGAGGGGAPERAAAALGAAGASLRDCRRLAGGLLEVRYEFLGEAYVSVVDEATLQVVDSGICLSGQDHELTLESLPSVLREAMQTGDLFVTAW